MNAVLVESQDRDGVAAAPVADPGGPAAGVERPLRIAMVVPPYFEVPPAGYGGVESVVADLTDALVARGHDVTLIGAGRPGTRARFVRLWDAPIPHRLGEPFPEVVHAALVRRAVQELVRGPGLDIVHDHTLAGPLNAPAYAAAALPTVVTMHGPVDEDLYRLYRALGPDIELVAISERQRQLAPDLHWTGMVHNAIRVDTFPYRTAKGDFALFLGRFHPQKAPHLALEAAHAAGLPLVLAGKCAEPIEREYFDREVAPRLTASDRVLGVADARAKRELLAQARCLLFPIRWEEPFGMVMIEAMACGTPVVALRGGAVPEVVIDGVTGYVCEDPAELPGALHRLDALDPAACRRRVVEHFDVDGLGAGYEAVYRRVLARRSAADGPARVRDRAPAASGADALELLRREYGDLDAALDQRYDRALEQRDGRHGHRGGGDAARRSTPGPARTVDA
ncbi:MAG TPA: glycosyltransferase family 4 protein [Pilimelia sp.]|nr:glycosyltransferase family 4 protein [Pilimelia sp.]